MAVAMEKVTYCRIDFLNFTAFNAGNRMRLFQDSIPKCLNFAIFKNVTLATEHHFF